MRITRHNDFIDYYLGGGRDQEKCGNLRIEGDKLFNYNTVIAQFESEDKIYINMTKYSTSTSRIQNYLLKEAERYLGRYGIKKFYDIDFDTQDLLN